jgi:hypothetical protein
MLFRFPSPSDCHVSRRRWWWWCEAKKASRIDMDVFFFFCTLLAWGWGVDNLS